MEFKAKLLTRAIQIMIVGCVSTSGFALTAKTLDKHTTNLIATKNDCFVAEKDCLLQVSPAKTSQGQKNFNVKQLCDPYYEKTIYSYSLPLKDQLSQRKFLGNKFCEGVVSISDMELPFSRGPDVQNANDGLLLVETAESAMNDVKQALDEMTKLAEEAASNPYSPVQMSDLNVQFQQVKNDISRIAETTSFNGMYLLTSIMPTSEIGIPINRGKKTIYVRLTTVTTGSYGLNIQDLDLLNFENAQAAFDALSKASFIVTHGIEALDRSKPELQAAIEHDQTLTTIDLNDDIIVVKKMGFSAD